MNNNLKPIWSYKKLNELGFIGRGKSKHRPRNDPSLYGGYYPFIQTGDVKAANLYISEYSQTYNEKGLAQSKLWETDGCIPVMQQVEIPKKLNEEWFHYGKSNQCLTPGRLQWMPTNFNKSKLMLAP